MKRTFKGFSGDDTKLLNNTDRGFRLETYLDVATGTGIYQYATDDAFEALNREIALYEEDCPKVAQVYFYLTQYKDKLLDEIAFQNMEKYFSILKEKKIKALLRFAYVWKDRDVQSQEPEVEWVLKHLEQLKPFLHENEGQINALQAGIVGAWGEWAFKARERMDETAILQKLLEVTPESMQIQVRYLNARNRNVDSQSEDFRRIGFHDDFLIGIPHVWNSAGKNPTSYEYRQLEEDSKRVLVDGEMIWWWANPIYMDTDVIDPVLMTKRMMNGHFTTLSLSHNYREMEFGSFEKQTWINELRRNGLPDSKFDEIQEEDYVRFSSMNEWKKTEILIEDIIQHQFPVQKEWFFDNNGNTRGRNYYEYLRDYLGYRLQATTLETKEGEVAVRLMNVGFASPTGLEEISIVLLDESGQVLRSEVFAPLTSFQTLEEVEKKISLSSSQMSVLGNTLHLAIRLHGKNGETSRLANDDVEWKNGLNILI